jgi:hypothetical protein
MDTTAIIEQEQAILDAQEANPLGSLVAKLDEQKKAKYDMVVPAESIQYTAGELTVDGAEGLFKVSELAHSQIGEKLEIPRAYYQRMLSTYPELLETNVNSWLSKKTKTKYLLRTFKYEGMDNICRAMLSNSYNIIDNYDILICALESIEKTGIHIEIVKAEVTDQRMYLHVVAPEIHVDATNLLDNYLADRNNAVLNNGIISGIVICNSEVGMGSYEISARAQVLKCRNGLHDRNARFRRVHLGTKLDDGVINWSDNTKNKNYELIMAQTQDSVKTYLSKDYLGQLTSRLQSAKDMSIENETGVIENISLSLSIPEAHKNNILKHFLRDGDGSALGVYQAISRETQKMTPDMQFDIESRAFELLPKMKTFDKPFGNN